MQDFTDVIPSGWALTPTGQAPMPNFFDTTPRLIPSAQHASNELVSLCGVWSPTKHPEFALVEPKGNGIRALFIGGMDPRLVSREGAPLGCAAHCLPSLLTLEVMFGKAMVFDAEFIVPGPKAPNPTISAFRRNKPELTGVMWLFDAVPLERWLNGGATAPLHARKKTLMQIMREMPLWSIGAFDAVEMNDPSDVLSVADHFWSSGFEGLVIKDGVSSYCRGRTETWLKLKEGN